MNIERFFVIARETGAENPAIPTWACQEDNAFALDELFADDKVSRLELDAIPGAYQLLNVLSNQECQQIIAISEALGYLKDAAVSLPREIRHNDNVTIVVDDRTERLIWHRIKTLVNGNLGIFDGKKPLGINARFRLYRYQQGDYFNFHTDGDWPGSRVIDNKLVTNAYPDRYSKMTFLVLLNDDFQGGETRFLVNANNPDAPARRGDQSLQIDVRTPAGAALLFPHGHHYLHCLHSSVQVTEGTKYIIRSDLLFELD